MNAAERQILDRAWGFLTSGAADAVSNGVDTQEWDRVCKEKAIEDLEILQLLDSSSEAHEPLNVPVTPAVKEGRYMGVAGGPPEYE